MNKRNQYTVMVETKEIRKICVVANSVEEAAELMCNVVANTDILQTDLSEDSEVFTEIAAYGKNENDVAKLHLYRVGVPCEDGEPTLGGMITPMQPAAAATVTAKLGAYPSFIIIGAITEPMAITVAGADPEMAAKNIHETTVTIASEPGIQPTTE